MPKRKAQLPKANAASAARKAPSPPIIPILASEDARKLYANCTAAVLRAKECVMKTATNIQEHAEDIYAEAQQINEDRAAKEAVIDDESDFVENTEEAAEAEDAE